MLLFLTGLICSLLCGSFANITPVQTKVYEKEGENVTLSCNYSSASTLQWYRQYPRSAPEFLMIIIHSTGKVSQKSDIVDQDPRFSAKLNEKKTHMYLEISTAKVTDSAIYYCALNTGGAGKLIFGRGTKLTVDSKETKEPVYYRHNGSCLATDFTNHKDVPSVFTPVRYTGKTYEKYYSSFAFKVEDKVCSEKDSECKGESSGQSDMELDEKINFVSLGLFWLRILLLKTVVFNILMTFKAWMS